MVVHGVVSAASDEKKGWIKSIEVVSHCGSEQKGRNEILTVKVVGDK